MNNELIVDALRQYLADPADSEFQEGYLACLLDLYEAAELDELSPEDFDNLHSMVQD